MAVYNGERYLDEAVSSILTQDFRDLELIIIDDASTDGTPGAVARWAERDARVVPVRLEANGGVSRALNEGMRIARGEYIARQDHDDVSEPGRLRAEAEVLDGDPGVMLVSTDLLMIDETGSPIGRLRRSFPPDAVAYMLHFFNVVGGGGQVMFRRAEAVEAGGYRLYVSEDYDLWTKLLERGRVVILPRIGMRYRVHPSSLSRTAMASRIELSNGIKQRMLSRLLGRAVSEEETRAAAHVWDGVAAPGLLRTALALMTQTWDVWMSRHPSSSAIRAVRRETASRILVAGMLLASRGHLNEFPAHLLASLRWSPVGSLRALRFALERLRWRLGRRFVKP
jgi:cellulose synthase/poly-beta-1,6-N-acetylglucosamine synthase-like glycosyltransferase